MDSGGLIANVTGKEQRRANLLTNTPNLKKVLVEDEFDVPVWYKILKKAAPQFDYHVTPYSFDDTAKGKGKANVLKFAAKFDKDFIGCVDSDFDWLLEDWTQDGGLIKNNDHILQTYAYAIENLASQPYGDSGCLLDCLMHSSELQREVDKDYTYFIGAISDAVYEVLLWHLLMWKDQFDIDDISKGWDFIFGNAHYNAILTDHSLSIEGQRMEILDTFRLRAVQLANNYTQKYSGFIGDRDSLKNDLSNRYGLSPENAYLFVRGHNLYDFLTHCFFKPIKDELISLHKDEIKAHNNPKDFQNLMNHYNNLIMDVQGSHVRKVEYMDDSHNRLTKAIVADVSKAFIA